MNGFRVRLRAAINRSPEYRGDVWALSKDANLGSKTVYNIINDSKLDYSKTGPGLFGMTRLAQLLGVSLDYLVNSSENKFKGEVAPKEVALATHALQAISLQADSDGPALSSDYLLRLYKKSGGRIEAFEHLFDRCDQYFPPSKGDSYPLVKAVGRNSLSSLTLGSDSVELVQLGFKELTDQEVLTTTMRDYRYAIKVGAVSEIVSRNLLMPNKPIRIKMDILRTLLAVEDADGEATLLLFAALII